MTMNYTDRNNDTGYSIKQNIYNKVTVMSSQTEEVNLNSADSFLNTFLNLA